MENRKMIAEGIIEECDGDAYLIGGKCNDCGSYAYPSPDFCTKCFSKNIERVRLSKKGTLYSYTITRMPTQHYPAPRALGHITLAEGVKIFAPLQNRADEQYEIGEEMELDVGELYKEVDNKGNEVSIIGYQFKSPVKD